MNNGKRKKWRKNNADRTREECLRAKGRVEIKTTEKAGSLFAVGRQFIYAVIAACFSRFFMQRVQMLDFCPSIRLFCKFKYTHLRDFILECERVVIFVGPRRQKSQVRDIQLRNPKF